MKTLRGCLWLVVVSCSILSLQIAYALLAKLTAFAFDIIVLKTSYCTIDRHKLTGIILNNITSNTTVQHIFKNKIFEKFLTNFQLLYNNTLEINKNPQGSI